MYADRNNQTSNGTGFRRGDYVTVRSLEEILATLDADAKFDGMPFMPEMAACCGKNFRVFRRAERTCVEGVGVKSMRNPANTVFLDGLRCDGSAHDGCQRGCLFFWKDAWLQKANDDRGIRDEGLKETGDTVLPDSALGTDRLVQLPTTKGDRYFCQSTELAEATSECPPGKLRHYLHDLRVGEITLQRFAYTLLLALSNRVSRLLRGRAFYQIAGNQKTTVAGELDLKPGELVEIKPVAEIQATLDDQGRNRGLSFEAEMAQHCGRRYRVARSIRKIILEQNGKMVQLGNTVTLDGMVCQGICILNCPRANYFYWREIWLKRV